MDRSAPELNKEINFLFGDGVEDDLITELYNPGEIIGSDHYVCDFSIQKYLCKFSCFT